MILPISPKLKSIVNCCSMCESQAGLHLKYESEGQKGVNALPLKEA